MLSHSIFAESTRMNRLIDCVYQNWFHACEEMCFYPRPNLNWTHVRSIGSILVFFSLADEMHINLSGKTSTALPNIASELEISIADISNADSQQQHIGVAFVYARESEYIYVSSTRLHCFKKFFLLWLKPFWTIKLNTNCIMIIVGMYEKLELSRCTE